MKTFRYSTLSDAHRCMRYYELKHLLGQDDGSDKSGDMAFGTALHAGVQDLFELGNGVGVFQEAWNNSGDKDLEYTRYTWADLMTLGVQLIEIFRDEHAHKFLPAHLEKRVETNLAHNIRFSGTIDFLGLYKDKRSVVDWKTSAMPYDAYKIKCNEQMYGYAYLAKHALGYQAEQVVYGVAVKDHKNPRWQFRVAPLTEGLLEDKIANVRAMCERLAAGGPFVKNPSACVVGRRICPFFSKCHSAGEAERSEGHGGHSDGEETT